jgi:hypothetical protein
MPLSLSQEIGEMLSNNLTLDEEDAVQVELQALQAEAASIHYFRVLSVADRRFQDQVGTIELEGRVDLPTAPTTTPFTQSELCLYLL